MFIISSFFNFKTMSYMFFSIDFIPYITSLRASLSSIDSVCKSTESIISFPSVIFSFTVNRLAFSFLCLASSGFLKVTVVSALCFLYEDVSMPVLISTWSLINYHNDHLLWAERKFGLKGCVDFTEQRKLCRLVFKS